MRYEPGTVAVATVRGEPGVRIVRTAARRELWFSIESHGHNPGGVDSLRWHNDNQVTDVRPLVVLDLGNYAADPRYLIDTLRNPSAIAIGTREWIADQIEAQTRPQPAEPTGRWAVVEGREGNRWLREARGAERLHPWRHIGSIDRWSSWEYIVGSYPPVEVLSPGVTP